MAGWNGLYKYMDGPSQEEDDTADNRAAEGWKHLLSDREAPDDRIEKSMDMFDVVPAEKLGLMGMKAAMMGKAALTGKLAFPGIMGALGRTGVEAAGEGAARILPDSARTAVTRDIADTAANIGANMPELQSAQQGLSRSVSQDQKFNDQLRAAKAAAMQKFRSK